MIATLLSHGYSPSSSILLEGNLLWNNHIKDFSKSSLVAGLDSGHCFKTHFIPQMLALLSVYSIFLSVDFI